MPSVVGLLEQHELAARRRVDGLREQADRIQAELAAAEREWQEWAIARKRVGTVLAPDGDNTVGTEVTDDPRDADAPPDPGDAAKPKSQVPVWRQGLAWSVLSVDYQRILTALADRNRLHQGPLTCQEMAAMFGMDVVPATGGGTALESETPGRPRLAGRAAAGPVHPRPGCGRARRRVMSRVIDQ
ncbi:hypothetical protein [Streptomyces deccanensis]|uniref:hypothetical protein n=1 Tax=Streptomyces deccanensis TaxID=424188 RepID=UPI003B84711D